MAEAGDTTSGPRSTLAPASSSVRNVRRAAFVLVAILCVAWVGQVRGARLGAVPGPQATPHPDDALLDMLVWGPAASIELQAYSADVKAEVEAHFRRANHYRSARPTPSSSELKMAHAAQVRYERRLVAVADHPDAPSLAAAYASALRPCYEWEGSSDCPEREARFADEYHAAHPDGPFRAYLPLLSAHRWLCAAEAYEYENQPADASRSRQLSMERLAVARRSEHVLVRTAAARLAVRGRCLATTVH